MTVILCRMRVGTRRLATLLLPLAACGGGDLLLPDDGTDDRAPVQLRALSGDGQTALVRSPVRYPLVVEALDRERRPVAGARIIFEFVDQPNGAAIAPAASQTDTSGRAAAEVTLGAPAGDQPVEARLDDPTRDLSVRFLLTALRPNNGGGGGDDDPPPDDGGGGGGGGDDGKGKGKGKGGHGGNGNGHNDED